MKDIQKLITNFRNAIELAKCNGDFDTDFSFNKFPCGCCGDASELLGEYLLENDVQPTYVSGVCYFNNKGEEFQTHAWLLAEGMIADITGDQFKDRASYYNYDIPDYCGPEDDFHRLFGSQLESYPFGGLQSINSFCARRLYDLYRKIKKYL